MLALTCSIRVMTLAIVYFLVAVFHRFEPAAIDLSSGMSEKHCRIDTRPPPARLWRELVKPQRAARPLRFAPVARGKNKAS